jgi:tripartite-type tricarboxylate transporter receptor subunit TctC
MTKRPTRSSGLYAFLIPAKTDFRTSPPKLSVSLSNFRASGTSSAVRMRATRKSTLVKSSIVHSAARGSACSGSGPSVTALVQNEVQVLFSGPGAALPQLKAGRIRGLAVSTLKRSHELPDLPTLDESGFKAFEISGWYGLAAPARTPQPVIARLNEELVKILKGGEAAQLLAKRGYDPAPTTPEEFGRYLQSEIARWTKAVKQFGINTLE